MAETVSTVSKLTRFSHVPIQSRFRSDPREVCSPSFGTFHRKLEANLQGFNFIRRQKVVTCRKIFETVLKRCGLAPTYSLPSPVAFNDVQG